MLPCGFVGILALGTVSLKGPGRGSIPQAARFDSLAATVDGSFTFLLV